MIFGRLSTDISNANLLTIDQVSTDHRPSVDQLLTDTSVKYRPTIGEMSAKYRWAKSYIGRDTSGTTIDRLSTVSRPSVDRLSSECRPLCRPSVVRLSTAISTNRSDDTTYSKHYPFRLASIFRFCEICWEYRTAGHLVFSTCWPIKWMNEWISILKGTVTRFCACAATWILSGGQFFKIGFWWRNPLPSTLRRPREP